MIENTNCQQLIKRASMKTARAGLCFFLLELRPNLARLVRYRSSQRHGPRGEALALRACVVLSRIHCAMNFFPRKSAQTDERGDVFCRIRAKLAQNNEIEAGKHRLFMKAPINTLEDRTGLIHIKRRFRF